MKRGLLVAVGWGAMLLAAACGRAAPPLLSPPDHRLMEPHWDQVCRDDRTPLVFRRVDEVADSLALVQLIEAGLRPSPGEDPGGGAPDGHGSREPWLEMAVSYGADGSVGSVHLLAHGSDQEEAAALTEAVAGLVRPQETLLFPTHLRLRGWGGPSPRVELRPAEHCLPHIAHEPGRPPVFLEGARVQGRVFLPRGAELQGSLAVRLEISRDGALTAIEPLRGDTRLLDRVERALAETDFNPALLNRHPVAGSLELTFTFPDVPDPE